MKANKYMDMLTRVENNGGLTLKRGELVNYKTGYQVANFGVECATIEAAAQAMDEMTGTCGVWYSEGVYYIDHSFRVNTKKKALEIGRAYNQISVLRWSDMSLVYC